MLRHWSDVELKQTSKIKMCKKLALSLKKLTLQYKNIS